MKTTLLTILFSIVLLNSFAQRSTGIVISQGVTNVTPNPNNLVWVDTVGATNYNWKLAKKDSLQWKPWNLVWLNDTIISIGNNKYVQLIGSYSNPNFINSLSASKLFGLSPVATSGNYSDLTGLPNLSLKYDASNPNGYISGINNGMVLSALGYSPLKPSDTIGRWYPLNSNPNNYQSKTVQATNGLLKVSSSTADTIQTDWNVVMSVNRATDSINSIKNLLNTKLNISDTTNKWLSKNTHIPQDPVNPDWNSSTGLSQILNKPSLFNGSYHNLIDTPSISSTNISNWNTAYGWGNWNTQGFIKGSDTISLSNRINTKLGYSDTLSLSTRINNKLNVLDTTNKWKSINYTPNATEINTALGFIPLKPSDTVSLNNRINQKLSIADTTGKWYPRYSNPSNYLTASDTNSLSNRINNKLGYPDTISLSNRINLKLNSSDTLSISNRINTKLTSTDTISLSSRINAKYTLPSSGTTAQYLNGLGNLVTFPTIPTIPIPDYTNTVAISGGSGNAVFYLTSDKTASGTALYTNILTVQPIVNDAALNYTYSWTISSDKKTLTVNVKAAVGLNVSLVGLTLLGVPSNVANGTVVNVLVKGN